MSQQNLNDITPADILNLHEINNLNKVSFSKHGFFKKFVLATGLLLTINSGKIYEANSNFSESEYFVGNKTENCFDKNLEEITNDYIEIDDSRLIDPLIMFDEKDYYADRIFNNQSIDLSKILDKLNKSNIDLEFLLSRDRKI